MESSLLILNDNCINEVFACLPFKDYVNLAMTCQRLRSIAHIEKIKYKNIRVSTHFPKRRFTFDEFSNILIAFGKHVGSVYLEIYSNDTIMKIIAEHCTKLSSVELVNKYFRWSWSNNYDVELPFRNLKKLKVGEGIYLSIDNWKKCFANNPGIEILQYNDREVDDDDENTFTPLNMLPKLKCLTIERISGLSDTEINYLSCLTNLTKFKFTLWDYRDHSDEEAEADDFNRLLIKLAGNLKLLELDFSIRCGTDTFVTLKSFLHLEVLSIRDTRFGHRVHRVPENTIFPSKLKHVTLSGFKISCNTVLSMVKRLQLLEGLIILSGTIFCDNNKYEYFPDDLCQPDDSMVISRIAEMLRADKRKLKITFSRSSIKYLDADDIFWDDDDYEERVCKHKYSDDVTIIIINMNIWKEKRACEYEHTVEVKD